MRVLELPPEIATDRSKQEVLQAWLDKGKLSISLSNSFPEGYKSPIEVWPMLLSDIFHHVVDAIVLETGYDRVFVQSELQTSFEEILRSERVSRIGKLMKWDQREPELPDPQVSSDSDCVEIIRIFLLKDSIRVLVLVGMWLPDEEEVVWGNLLYDLTSIIASSLQKDGSDELRNEIAQKLVSYIIDPNTEYSGQYYSK